MIRSYNLYLLFVLAFLSSCAKLEDPVALTIKPGISFYFKGYVNGEYTDLRPGLNKYYMNTAYSFIDDRTYYRFSGEFAPEGCSDCPNTLKISINDRYASPKGSSSNIDNTLKAGYRIPFNEHGGLPYNRVIITYIDAHGKKYSSEKLPQEEGEFLIHYVNNFLPDKNHHQTKEIKASFNCRLLSESDNSFVLIDNAETIFSVSFP